MRKPDNKRPGPGGKGRSFKSKDAGKTDRKAGSRPYSDKPKRRDDDSFAGRKERSGEDSERKPRRSLKEEGDRPSSSASRKPYRSSGDKKDSKFGDKPRRTSSRSFGDKPQSSRPHRGAGEGEDRPQRRETDGDEKPDSYRAKRNFDDRGERKSFRSAGGERDARSGERKSRPAFGDKPRRRSAGSDEKPRRSTGSRDERRGSDDEPRRKGGDREERPKRRSDDRAGKAPFSAFRNDRTSGAGGKKGRPDPSDKPRRSSGNFEDRGLKKRKDEADGTRRVKYDDFEEGKVFSKRPETGDKPDKRKAKKAAPTRLQSDDGKIRLNKYLSNAGVASRREADTLIQSGVVKVNGVVVDQLGYKINPDDKVTYADAVVRSERKVYLLLNKPKDYITTTDDPQERKTVMELIAKACKERVYPVGRLDRNTTGLLLFTNDGDLTTKLMHPKFRIKKVYHVSLNKGLKPEDFKAILDGIELEDGLISADDLAFVGEGKKEIGIEIHSGRNRIVRRIFEHLGYDVIKLDRVSFAGLTKKDLPRGKYRFLTAKELGFLHMIG